MNLEFQSIIQRVIQAFRVENIDSAHSLLKEAMQVDIDNAETIFELGIAYAKVSKYNEALAIFCCLQPYKNHDVKIPYNMGLIYSLQGKHQLALEAYDNALKIQPEDAETLINKGALYNDINNYDLALEALEKAIEISPNIPEAWSNKGIALNYLNLYQESISAYHQATKLNPIYYEAWSNKSVPLNKLKRFLEASEACDKALSLKPDYAEAHYNKGNVLNELKRFDEAIAHYDRALDLKPNYHEALTNKGNVLNELKRFDEAIAHYDRALDLKPNYHEASLNKSLSLLLQGDFENGLELYENRWHSEKASEVLEKRFFDKPTWLGRESLHGKVILLYGEQGLGDFIQFCRYGKLVSALGAEVILETPSSLAGLMEDLEGISQIVIKGEELPFFDYQCSLMSLPLAFRTNLTTIPWNGPYLLIDAIKVDEWSRRLGSKLKPRVGLVWSGNPHHKNDHNRSLLLEDILPFLPSKFEYISLQREVREVDKLTLDLNPHIRSFASDLKDFVDTAALINNLDLVISVDTSVAHLSGALGKKTLVLLPDIPDWRWMLTREDSPWYPTIQLYRQLEIGDWNSALVKLKLDLNCS